MTLKATTVGMTMTKENYITKTRSKENPQNQLLLMEFDTTQEKKPVRNLVLDEVLYIHTYKEEGATRNTYAHMIISNQAKGIPITVPWKAQRLTSEDGKPITSTRVPDPYSEMRG